MVAAGAAEEEEGGAGRPLQRLLPKGMQKRKGQGSQWRPARTSSGPRVAGEEGGEADGALRRLLLLRMQRLPRGTTQSPALLPLRRPLPGVSLGHQRMRQHGPQAAPRIGSECLARVCAQRRLSDRMPL